MVIGANPKPNPKPRNALVQNTSKLAFCGGSIPSGAALVVWL
jgi:hypothetical protein